MAYDFEAAAGGLINQLKKGYTAGVNLKKPMMLYKAIKARIKGRLGLRAPKHIYVALTYACNLHCNHCFASKMKQKDKKPLSYDEYKELVRQAEKMGIYGFDFTGGEVFLRQDLPEIIKLFNPSRNTISIVTNASRITREKLVELKKAGLDTLSVSLDSGIPEEHDEFRHEKGLFDQAVQSLKYANEVGLKSMICVTVLNDTIRTESFAKLLDLSKELGSVLNVNYGAMVGNWASRGGIAFSEENKKYLFELMKTNPQINRSEVYAYKWGCSAMKELIYVTAYGEVMSCPYIHISFGNIRNEPLETIYKRALNYELFNQYPPVCLTGEDEDFITNIMEKVNRREEDPVSYKDVEEEIIKVGKKYSSK